MSLLWAVPPVAVAVAAAITLLHLRHLGAAAAGLRVELERVTEVRAAVLELRSASTELETSFRDLRRH